jgi:phospholipid transport system substrate-binding protein
MVRETIDAVLVVVRDKSLSRDQRLDRIESIAEGRFDFSTISRLILARNWRRLSAQQRDDFVTEFKRHLSLTYGQSIDSYKDERVTVEGARAERNGDVTVRTKVEGASATPVLVDYRLRDRDGAWTCIDVIIEGVSLLQNFRTQTQEIIHEVGPDGLVQRLREKNDARASAS